MCKRPKDLYQTDSAQGEDVEQLTDTEPEGLIEDKAHDNPLG